jgi:hypothetical protein
MNNSVSSDPFTDVDTIPTFELMAQGLKECRDKRTGSPCLFEAKR